MAGGSGLREQSIKDFFDDLKGVGRVRNSAECSS